mgnify:CR=1 FL=1
MICIRELEPTDPNYFVPLINIDRSCSISSFDSSATGSTLLLAEFNGVEAGLASYHLVEPFKPNDLEANCTGLFVHKSLRNRGIGSILFHSVIQWCSKDEAKRVYWDLQPEEIYVPFLVKHSSRECCGTYYSEVVP